MNIGIIVHSQSGHTAQMAKAIAAQLTRGGHEVDTILLMTSGMSKPGSRRFTINNAPADEDLAQFDAIFFGGPVWAFKASPVIMRYLGELPKLSGKPAACFVTMGLPWRSLGGTRALFTMNKRLEVADASVMPGEILHYFFGFNKQRLEASA